MLTVGALLIDAGLRNYGGPLGSRVSMLVSADSGTCSVDEKGLMVSIRLVGSKLKVLGDRDTFLLLFADLAVPVVRSNNSWVAVVGGLGLLRVPIGAASRPGGRCVVP